MDPAVQAALNKWPTVPACYGWLSLDRRGQWRLQGEPVRHAGLSAFMNRNYGCDDQGNWFVQNGPQKVYVALEYTPWIVRIEGDDQLISHTGQVASAIDGAWLDDEGSLLLSTSIGVALLDDRDLPSVLDRIRVADGIPASEDQLQELMGGTSNGLRLCWQDQDVPLAFIHKKEAPARFGYVPEPQPAS